MLIVEIFYLRFSVIELDDFGYCNISFYSNLLFLYIYLLNSMFVREVVLDLEK